MISSDADQALGLAFPIGTKLSNLPKVISGSFRHHEAGRENSQFNFFTTPGHNDSVPSHRVLQVAILSRRAFQAEPCAGRYSNHRPFDLESD